MVEAAKRSTHRSIDVLDYQVIVGGGMLQTLGVVCQRVAPAARYAIISDEQVARHWLKPATDWRSPIFPTPDRC